MGDPGDDSHGCLILSRARVIGSVQSRLNSSGLSGEMVGEACRPAEASDVCGHTRFARNDFATATPFLSTYF